MQETKRPENKHKRYVSVIACFPRLKPEIDAKIMRIQFGNGEVFMVDKTRQGYPAAAQKAGGQGILYNILASRKLESEFVYQGQPQEFRLFTMARIGSSSWMNRKRNNVFIARRK